MATVAQLNVEIGARIAGLQKGLRQAERELRQSGRNMAAMGNEMTLALSVPLLGVGVAAIKTAGDMEALRLAMRATFEGAGRSIQEADAELEKLREAAKAPGLDFEQAVRGSIRLQNVGFTAEKARETVSQLANTIATTGGTASDLDEVVNQFSQMIGKGGIFQDDLKIITGRMPKVAQLMREAFGTTTAEGLNKLGVDARTFVDTILKKMEEMPRVTGGVSNSIVNAWSSVKQSLATLGESLNKTFNVSGRLDQFANWIEGVANGFAGLSEGAQTAILGIGIFVAALGPAIRAGGLLAQSIYGIGNAFTALKIEALKSQVLGLVGWWKQLDIVMKANIIGVTVGVVLALAAAFSALSENTSVAAEISKTAAQNIAAEKSRIDILLPTLKSEVASREQKAAALAELKKISPQYFGQLDSEKSKVDDITKAYDAYIANLLRSAKAAAAREKLVDIEKQLLDIDQRRGNLDQGEKLALGMIGVTSKMNVALEKQKAVLDAQAAPLEAQKQALAGIVTENEMVARATKKVTDNLGDNTKTVKESETEYDGAARRVRLLAQSMIEASDAAKVFNTLQPLAALPQRTPTTTVGHKNGQDIVTTDVVSQNSGAPAIINTLSILPSVLNPAKQILDTFWDGFLKGTALTSEAILSAGGQIESTMNSLTQAGIGNMEALGRATLSYALDAFRANMLAGLAEVLKGALSSVPFPFNIAIAGAAVAGASALFKGLQNKIVSPKLAKGGLAYGPTSAIVGDNPGARFDPEVIAPLSKLRSIIGGSAGAAGTIRVEGVIRGRDIYLTNEREAQHAKRTKG